MTDICAYIRSISADAKAASYLMAKADTKSKNNALIAIANLLSNNKKTLLDANKIDMENSHKKGLDTAMLDRLQLT